MLRALFCLIATSLLTACATKLVVSRGYQANLMPVRTPLLVEVETTTTYTELNTMPPDCRDQGYCAAEVATALQFLPLGDQYYVGFDPGKLSKAGFALKFNENGSLAELGVNSEPSIDPLSGLLETILPFVAAPKEAEAEDGGVGPAGLVPPGARTCPLTIKEIRERYCTVESKRVTAVSELEIDRLP